MSEEDTSSALIHKRTEPKRETASLEKMATTAQHKKRKKCLVTALFGETGKTGVFAVEINGSISVRLCGMGVSTKKSKCEQLRNEDRKNERIWMRA